MVSVIALADEVVEVDQYHVSVDGVIYSKKYLEENQFSFHSALLEYEDRFFTQDPDLEANINNSNTSGNFSDNSFDRLSDNLLKVGNITGQVRYPITEMPESETFTKAVRKAANSVVYIQVPYKKDTNKDRKKDYRDKIFFGKGSGVLIDCDSCILTSVHVIYENYGEPNQRLRGDIKDIKIAYTNDLNGKYTYVRKVYAAEPYKPSFWKSLSGQDLVMLHVESDNLSSIKPLKVRAFSEREVVGSKVIQVGFPKDGNSKKIAQECKIREKSKYNYYYGRGSVAITDCTGIKRNSGGPYLNYQGQIVSIHTSAKGGDGEFDSTNRYSVSTIIDNDVVNFVQSFSQRVSDGLNKVKAYMREPSNQNVISY